MKKEEVHTIFIPDRNVIIEDFKKYIFMGSESITERADDYISKNISRFMDDHQEFMEIPTQSFVNELKEIFKGIKDNTTPQNQSFETWATIFFSDQDKAKDYIENNITPTFKHRREKEKDYTDRFMPNVKFEVPDNLRGRLLQYNKPNGAEKTVLIGKMYTNDKGKVCRSMHSFIWDSLPMEEVSIYEAIPELIPEHMAFDKESNSLKPEMCIGNKILSKIWDATKIDNDGIKQWVDSVTKATADEPKKTMSFDLKIDFDSLQNVVGEAINKAIVNIGKSLKEEDFIQLVGGDYVCKKEGMQGKTFRKDEDGKFIPSPEHEAKKTYKSIEDVGNKLIGKIELMNKTNQISKVVADILINDLILMYETVKKDA